MSNKHPSDIAASVRQRLKNATTGAGDSVFQRTLDRYVIERLLYRLSQSPHRDRFVLKGAMLFTIWEESPHRATRDLDLLGFGDSEPAHLVQTFQEIVTTEVEPDGLIFLLDTLVASVIKEDQEYEGVRLQLTARLGQIRLPVQIDIGFGDAILPLPQEATMPTILEQPAPRLLVYPRETVIAEKFQAMVELGMINTRMKDFYDVWILSRTHAFEGSVLSQAILGTFNRRQTPLPTWPPIAFTPEFHQDRSKQSQWLAFVKRSQPREIPDDLATAMSQIEAFLRPLAEALIQQAPPPVHWVPPGPWTR